MAKDKTILLTFDVEEFDLPVEYDCHINTELQLEISRQGLNTVLSILSEHGIRATFFTTAYFAERYPELIRIISQKHEICSHMYYHSVHRSNDAEFSRLKLSEIIQGPVSGFRSPRLKAMPLKEIARAGYQYDSSLNPTYIPGRYNNFLKKRRIHIDTETGLTIVPVSVSPFLRIPLFWLTFKNINYRLYLLLCRWSLRHDHYLHLYFHPWEFSDLSSWNIPRLIKSHSGTSLANRFSQLLKDLKRHGNFETISSFLNRNKF